MEETVYFDTTPQSTSHPASEASSNDFIGLRSSSVSAPSSTSTVSDRENSIAKGQKPRTRRGHFKSRLGCLNCKRRRVKCNEGRPTCSHCSRVSLVCVYPLPEGGPSSVVNPTLRSSLSILTLQDLNFYHRFLTVATPTMPLKGDELWSQAAAMSHQYDYLAHALLAVGASHASQNGDIQFTTQALQHRVVAIGLFNEQLGRPTQSATDADAMFAAIGCLLTQAALLPDSMVEYMMLNRIAGYIVTNITPKYKESIFGEFTPWRHIETLMSMISEQPRDLELVESFKSSMLQLGDICQTDTELDMRAQHLCVVETLQTSSHAACRKFVHLFLTPHLTFSNEEFLQFFDAKNLTGRLITIHMLLLDYMLGQFCIGPSNGPKSPGRKKSIIGWARSLASSLPEDHQVYIEWPLRYCEILEHLDARYLLHP